MSSDHNSYKTASRTGSDAQVIFDAGLRKHMLRVYNLMCAGIALTGIVSLLVAQSPAMLNIIYNTPLKWVVMLAPFGFILAMNFGINKMSPPVLQAVFWAFCAVFGLSLSYIFIAYTGASIAKVFFITSASFAGLSAWGYTTKKDLSGMGSFMVIGLFGIVIASIVNIFLQSSGLGFAISIIGVLVFAGLTAWDTQRIKETYSEGHGREEASKLAIMSALNLYLNFINMFLFLLQLIGNRE